ncbi:Rtg1 protein [Martiniozyma asiatica (nom. inval.)]|nr:Rtg1 protein [Martiniozyma asiatica]
MSPPERKRRDNLNERIQDLLELIPQSYFQDKSTGTKDGRPNKGQILSRSVDYILYLQNEIDKRNRAEVELLLRLRQKDGQAGAETANDDIHTTAEILLQELGIGPLS